VTLAFEIGGCLTISVVDPDSRVDAFLRSQMDPCPPQIDRETAGLVLTTVDRAPERELLDVQNPAGDGLVTASDGSGFYVLRDGLACRVPDSLRQMPARFEADRGFPLWRIYGTIVRPMLQVQAVAQGAAVAHGASVAVNGAGVVVAGWSETGKTETALALIERGATFLSDKWTVVRPDGSIAVFPISVGVRRWVLRYLPRLRASLPAGARGQFVVAGLFSAAARSARLIPSAGKVLGVAQTAIERAAMMADRAALTPTQVRHAYAQDPAASWTAPLRLIAHLTTISGSRVDARTVGPAWAAHRLARSAAFERRAIFELYERRRFAFPDSSSISVDDVVREEASVLESAFANATVLDVRAPFPTDPRPVAEAIERFL
jgi:hypothetical protein